jgi:hypothetical protein
MAWRVAVSLDVLLAQVNAYAPRRSKASDGSIGDAEHATRDSDHNPWYGPGIVTARDFTHDPAGGLDCQWLADQLVASRDPRIKYVIWNRRIIEQGGWQWTGYSGPNPHTAHLHLSVTPNGSCDDPRPWAIDDVSWTEQLTFSDPFTGKTSTYSAQDWLMWANFYTNQVPALTARVNEIAVIAAIRAQNSQVLADRLATALGPQRAGALGELLANRAYASDA